MITRLSTQVASAGLATLVTVAVLVGLNSLASSEHAASQIAKTAATLPA